MGNIIIVIIIIVIIIKLSKKEWKYYYDGNNIIVKNTAIRCSLIINNEIVDVKTGNIISAKLHGILNNGKDVNVKIGQGLISLKCSLFVGEDELFPIKSTSSYIKDDLKSCPECGEKYRITSPPYEISKKLSRNYTYSYCHKCEHVWPDPGSYVPDSMLP